MKSMKHLIFSLGESWYEGRLANNVLAEWLVLPGLHELGYLAEVPYHYDLGHHGELPNFECWSKVREGLERRLPDTVSGSWHARKERLGLLKSL